jgi:hypothetical protein
MNVITPLVQFQQQIRIFHWQSDTYAQHKAFGKLYENLDGLVDDFIETYMGIFGKSKPTNQFTFVLDPLSEVNLNHALNNFDSYLKDMNYELEDHTDLLNIRDSMLGEVNKLRYLLTLK